jgi:hypothetical protein
MAPAMPWQKYQISFAQLAADEFAGWLSKRGSDFYLANFFEPFHLVEAAAADDSEYLPLLRHGPSSF